MTKKFDESLENTDWVVVASPTLKRQRASNQAVQDGQQCIFDATSPTAPNSQHQESQERAVLDHWQPILSNVIILAFWVLPFFSRSNVIIYFLKKYRRVTL